MSAKTNLMTRDAKSGQWSIDDLHTNKHETFNYESKVWGANEVRLSPTHLNALRLQYCLEALEDVTGRVLEIGCGAGGMTRALRHYRPDLEFIGCDLSRAAIRIANSKEGLAEFTVSDAYHLAFPDRMFAAVVMFDVLEHLDAPELALAEISRVMDAGSTFHLFVPCEGGMHTLHGLLENFGWNPKELLGGHIQMFEARNIRELLGEQGFSVLDSQWSGHFINQIADVGYFTLLSMWGKNSEASVESYIDLSKGRTGTRPVAVVKDAIAIMSYCESRLLHNLPGWGLHVTCTEHDCSAA